MAVSVNNVGVSREITFDASDWDYDDASGRESYVNVEIKVRMSGAEIGGPDAKFVQDVIAAAAGKAHLEVAK